MKFFDPDDVTRHDLKDALDHISDLVENDSERYFRVSYNPRKRLSSILDYDDYSAWGELSSGELLSEREEAVRGFRGEAWQRLSSRWHKPEDVPPVMLIEWDGGQAIGDGRGRVNLAVGMNWKYLPAYTIKEVPEHSRHDFSWQPGNNDIVMAY